MESLPEDHFVTSLQFTKRVYRDQYSSIDPSSTELSQKGKVVVITGASRGLGARALAPAFAKAGAKAIVLVARDLGRLKTVEAELKGINADVQLLSLAADISDAGSVANVFKEITSKFSHADVLINNAGVLKAEGLIKDVDPSSWWREFEINSFGTFLFTQQFLKALPEKSRATVINMTSGAAYQIYPGLSAYSLSKMISLQLASQIAAEHPNVTAIALHPGIVETDMTADMFRPFANDTPELVGGVAVWLCTDKAHFLTGRFVNSNWSVDDLLERSEEIQGGNKLKLDLQGTFGASQFE